MEMEVGCGSRIRTGWCSCFLNRFLQGWLLDCSELEEKCAAFSSPPPFHHFLHLSEPSLLLVFLLLHCHPPLLTVTAALHSPFRIIVNFHLTVHISFSTHLQRFPCSDLCFPLSLLLFVLFCVFFSISSLTSSLFTCLHGYFPLLSILLL